ncbi:LexA family transcriptional regulator [Pseudomonas sp. USHLN015]|uniref:LexA family transcriptional regulator n=1 Tax=Pseudomonas sp. USHLN015 TaxID=3081296 RepID=UPI00301E0A6E
MIGKRQLEDWEKAECAALKAEIAAYNASKPRGQRITQEAVGVALGMYQGSVSNFLNGRTLLNIEFAIGISQLIGVPVERFSPRLAKQIARMSAIVDSIGEGLHSMPVREVGRYPLISWTSAVKRIDTPDYMAPDDGKEWYETLVNPGRNGYWLPCKGKSMVSDTSPSFPEGLPILVQPEGFEMEDGKYYIAYAPGMEATFKQYIVEAGVKYLASLNPSFRPIEMGDDWVIIGRVIDAKSINL